MELTTSEYFDLMDKIRNSVYKRDTEWIENMSTDELNDGGVRSIGHAALSDALTFDNDTLAILLLRKGVPPFKGVHTVIQPYYGKKFSVVAELIGHGASFEDLKYVGSTQDI